jgi:hypothetical protein
LSNDDLINELQLLGDLVDGLPGESVLRNLPSELLDDVADEACVPRLPESRKMFCRALMNCLFSAWDDDDERRLRSILRKDKKFSRAIASLHHARQALGNLSELHRKLFDLPTAVLAREIDGYLDLIGEKLGPVCAPRRGKPAGAVRDQAFHDFVYGLLEAAARTGGRLTLEKNIGRGTLISVLERLRGYLPIGFVPKRPPFSTLQRIKREFEESRRAHSRSSTSDQ